MKTEKIFIGLIFIGIALKLLHVTGAAAILSLALLGLSVAYIILNWYLFRDKKTKAQNLLLSIVGGVLFLSIAPIGMLFKLQHWVGARVVSELSFLMISLFLLIVLVIKNLSKKEELRHYYKTMYQRTLVLFIAISIVLIIPPYTYAHLEYWDNATMAEVATKYYTDPENMEYKKQYFDAKESIQHNNSNNAH